MSPTRIILLASLLLGSVVLAQETKPATATPTKAEIARWVKVLGHDDFAVREEASARLAEVVTDAEPELREAAKSPDAEVAYRAKRLLERFLPMHLQGDTASHPTNRQSVCQGKIG